MKRSKLLVIAVIILGLALLLALTYKKLPILNPQTKIGSLVNFEMTGILREMGLDEEFKTKRFISEGLFQLTKLNTDDGKKLPYKATSLFIEKYPNDLTDLVGKCVTVKGKLDVDWITKIDKTLKENKFMYEALVFIPSSVDKNDYSKCDGYTDSSGVIPEASKTVTLSGIIKRQPRLVPDVGPYDYILILTEPYISEENASGKPQKIGSISIAPQNNDVWAKLESKIDKATAVEAYELWGYFESKYLLVTRVME